MTYVSQDNATHDLLKAAAAMTALIGTTDFSQPIPAEEAHGLYRASAQVEARADVLRSMVGADYRDRERTTDKALLTTRPVFAPLDHVRHTAGTRGIVAEGDAGTGNVFVAWEGTHDLRAVRIAHLRHDTSSTDLPPDNITPIGINSPAA